MKKVLSFLCVVFLATAPLLPALAQEAPVDTVASASVSDFYAADALEGDALMDAVNSFSGFYLISTVNQDGTPNAGFFVYGCVKYEDRYYLQFGLAENQTHQNLLRSGQCVAVYAAAPDLSAEGAKPFAVSGARMWASLVTDETLLAQLNPKGDASTLFFEIQKVRPLG